MAGRHKHSKKPLYAKAFELFCDGKAPGEIAHQLELPVDTLLDTIERQRWTARRATLAGQHAVAAAETRMQAQVAVDSTLVRATQSAADALASAYVRLIEEASALPTHPYASQGDAKDMDPNEQYRIECQMIREKAAVMREATSGLRELIGTAQSIGMLKVERSGKSTDGRGDADKPIDLAKLTQLQVAVVTAKEGATRILARLAPADAPMPRNADGEADAVNVTASAA